MDNDGDKELISRIANMEVLAFDSLYKKYYQIITSYLVSLDGHSVQIEDIVQEVFLRVWEKKGNFKADSTVKTYLFGIAKNVLLEKQKRLFKERTINNEQLFEYKQISPNMFSKTEQEGYQEKMQEVVQQAMPQLTTKEKEAIKLFYMEKKSIEEAAKSANCSIKAFEGRLIRARSRLHRLLEDWEVQTC